MNIRKPIDYSVMYAELDEISSKNLPQMEEIYAIGRAICKRSEKGAAVMAAEYLQDNYPNRTGFSPRNVRRMRDFYRANEPKSFGYTRIVLSKTAFVLNPLRLQENPDTI